MATYKSDIVSLMAPAQSVFERLSNLENLGALLQNVPEDKIPADQKAMLEQIRISGQTISFPGGPAGEITLRLVEAAAPSLIKLQGEGTPVPMSMAMHITSLTPDTCEAYVEIDIQIPAMLKPMINGPMQKMADQFAHMLRQIPFN